MNDGRPISRGAEWRKWDLHVHSPFSALNNGFGADFGHYAKALMQGVFEKDIFAVGITDYFSIQGYKAFKELLADRKTLLSLVDGNVAKKALSTLFLPNVELRSTVIIRQGDQDSRVNFHVIFSDQVTVEEIEEHFLRELKFTTEGQPDSPDSRSSLTEKNLAELGKRLKREHQRFKNMTDLAVGMMNATIAHEQVTETLESQVRFKGKYLFLLPADEDLSKVSWHGQGHLTRKLLLQKAHAVFSSNGNTRAFCLGKKHRTVEEYVKEFKGLKPCLHGSDAHSYSELFEPADRRYTWIKADPTFAGLRQTINEPEERVYIGVAPPVLADLAARKTRVIDVISINGVTGLASELASFECDIPLNPQLVAIIGNKGNGKSAMADIIALAGNTKKYEAFSFLRADRFREARGAKAKSNQCSIRWSDGTQSEPLSLDRNPLGTAVEKVRYIPQQYLETICNELAAGLSGQFYQELQAVIFSHIPENDRLGRPTLPDLLEYRSKEINSTVESRLTDLREANRQIEDLRQQLSPEFAESLQQQLLEKQRELLAHEGTKPLEIPNPSLDPEVRSGHQKLNEQLKALGPDIAGQEAHIAVQQQRDGELAKKISVAQSLFERAGKLRNMLQTFRAQSEAELASLGIDVDQVFIYTLNEAVIEDARVTLVAERNAVQCDLNPNVPDSATHKLKNLRQQQAEITQKLGDPQILYQRYLDSLQEWEEQRAIIEGTSEKAGTARYLQQQIADLELLPQQIARLVDQRNEITRQIVQLRGTLRIFYAEHCKAVQDFLENHYIIRDGHVRLSFEAVVTEQGFIHNTQQMIDHRRNTDIETVKQLVATPDWSCESDVLQFCDSVDRAVRGNGGGGVFKQGRTSTEWLNFVYGCEYLRPVYYLTFEGKKLEQLSPGERGNLLLIFYLLLDKETIPLVIDQPEENLDNQTIVRTLVPCLKEAKRRRQVVIVTHNPNLAVVCDAEQIIFAEVEKGEIPKFLYSAGSIENPEINCHLLNVLEGTRPAFDMRDAKYLEKAYSW